MCSHSPTSLCVQLHQQVSTPISMQSGDISLGQQETTRNVANINAGHQLYARQSGRSIRIRSGGDVFRKHLRLCRRASERRRKEMRRARGFSLSGLEEKKYHKGWCFSGVNCFYLMIRWGNDKSFGIVYLFSLLTFCGNFTFNKY